MESSARDQARVYESDPEGYERLVAAEDWCGNLIPALERIAPLDGARVLEVGVGTGRIARQLLARGANVTGFDRADPMLAVARSKLAEVSATGWELANADARQLPVPSRSFDLAVAGWVFGHLRHWLPDDWRASIGEALDEMRRALKPGGTLVVIETLGTGTTEPAPPNPDLAEYYRWLELDQGLTRTSIRTDYDFPTVDAAAEATAAFFGAAFAERVRSEGWARIPECTGIWWKTVDGAIGATTSATPST